MDYEEMFSESGEKHTKEAKDFDHDESIPKEAVLRLIKLKLSKLCAENNKKEHEAIEGYDETLHCLKKTVIGDGDNDADDNLPQEFRETCKKFRDDITEITRDELNHAKKLEKWHLIFSGLEPMED